MPTPATDAVFMKSRRELILSPVFLLDLRTDLPAVERSSRYYAKKHRFNPLVSFMQRKSDTRPGHVFAKDASRPVGKSGDACRALGNDVRGRKLLDLPAQIHQFRGLRIG
jgi:hypothetical protein